jgi:heme-degrading monooxygenase HmoA
VKPQWHRGAVTLTLTLVLAALNGCAISTPWPRPLPLSADLSDEPVVLVLTRVVVNPAQRSEFDQQNGRVMASMGSQPGLIGYAARRQLFGDEGWTMSVWANEEARAAFVRSALHREAIAKSLPALRSVELKRLTIARKDLPTDWEQALRLLADPEGRRNYWE